MARMRLAGLGGVGIALNAVPNCEMGVVGGGGRLFRRKAAFRFAVMGCRLFIMMRGIVMMSSGRM
jgi:hypothetical protein